MDTVDQVEGPVENPVENMAARFERYDCSEGCPVEAALEQIAGKWKGLIIYHLLDETLRFNELSKAVGGIAPNVLSARLERLQDARVITSTPYSQRPLRYEYRLTDEGHELAGVLRLLSSWGQGAESSEAGLRHDACGTRLEAQWYCPTCAAAVAEEEGTELRRL